MQIIHAENPITQITNQNQYNINDPRVVKHLKLGFPRAPKKIFKICYG